MSNDMVEGILFSGEFIAMFLVLFIPIYWLLGRWRGKTNEPVKLSKWKRIIFTVLPVLVGSGVWFWLFSMFAENIAAYLLLLPVIACTGMVLSILFYRASGMRLVGKNEGRSAKPTKRKRIVISIVSTVVAMALLLYLAFGFLSAKPGMNGFEVTNGVIYMIMTNKDYVRVGENRYLCKTGSLSKLIENEYDSLTFNEYEPSYDTPMEYESSVIKDGVVSKNGQEFEAHSVGLGAWSVITGETIHSLYYAPCK